MATDDRDYIKLCKFKELFSGRFSTEEAGAILNSKNGHLDESVHFVLNTESRELRQFLERERQSWVMVEKKGDVKKRDRNKKIPLSILEQARSGKIDTDFAQFACLKCDRFWWRRTPSRKKVSRCEKCKKRYDEVPPEKQWGWAEFNCKHCGHYFRGWCAMDQKSACYGCSAMTAPDRILHSEHRKGPRSLRKHSCDGCTGPEMTCVHPQTRLARGYPKVVTPSQLHQSSHSNTTVDTFLSQTDLTKRKEVFFPPLPIVPERDEGSDTGNFGSDADE